MPASLLPQERILEYLTFEVATLRHADAAVASVGLAEKAITKHEARRRLSARAGFVPSLGRKLQAGSRIEIAAEAHLHALGLHGHAGQA